MYRSVGVLAAVVVFATACTGSSDTAVTTAVDDTEIDSPPEPAANAEIAPGLFATQVTAFNISPDGGTAECEKVAGSFDASTASIDFRLNAPACRDTGNMEALNGNLGDYVTIDDVAAIAIVGASTSGTVNAGEYTAFEHRYTECTNECTDFVTPMVLLEFTNDVVIGGATYQSMILQGDARDSLDGVIEVARSLSVIE